MYSIMLQFLRGINEFIFNLHCQHKWIDYQLPFYLPMTYLMGLLKLNI